MSNRQILVGMAAVFVGLTALLVVAGVVVNPLLLAIAVPFGAVAYLLWYHASGKLQDRIRREAEQAGPRERDRARQRARTAENRRDAYRTAGADGAGANRGNREGRVGGSTRAGGTRAGSRDPRDRAPSANRMSVRAAYDTLGLDAEADPDEVRAAYREKAKELHPDSEGGDEEAFKRLNEAYEVAKQ